MRSILSYDHKFGDASDVFNLGIDRDCNGKISKAEFVSIIEDREAARTISDLGVNVEVRDYPERDIWSLGVMV